MPPVSKSSASAVNNATESNTTARDCYEEFDQFLSGPNSSGKFLIFPERWGNMVAKILEFLQSDKIFLNTFENKEYLSKLNSKLDNLLQISQDNNLLLNNSEFLKTRPCIIQLYELIHNNRLLKNLCLEEANIGPIENFILNIIQKLFDIFLRELCVKPDLASKLLKDQNIISNHNYLQSDTIAWLIVKDEGSLDDLINSQKRALMDESSLQNIKDIIKKVMNNQVSDLTLASKRFTTQRAKLECVKKRVSIFQTKVIEPLKKIEGLFEKLTLSMIKHVSRFRTPDNLESIECLYSQELEKLIHPLSSDIGHLFNATIHDPSTLKIISNLISATTQVRATIQDPSTLKPISNLMINHIQDDIAQYPADLIKKNMMTELQDEYKCEGKNLQCILDFINEWIDKKDKNLDSQIIDLREGVIESRRVEIKSIQEKIDKVEKDRLSHNKLIIEILNQIDLSREKPELKDQVNKYKNAINKTEEDNEAIYAYIKDKLWGNLSPDLKGQWEWYDTLIKDDNIQIQRYKMEIEQILNPEIAPLQKEKAKLKDLRDLISKELLELQKKAR